VTCVVGLVDSGKVWLGGDSAATNTTESTTVRETKVFNFGPLVVGIAGEFRGAQVLRYAIKPPKRLPRDPMHWLVATFIPTLRHAYAAHGVTEHPDYLVGIEGRLFDLDGDLQVLERTGPFTAIGSGGDFALGAHHALRATGKTFSPQHLIERTLSAAAHYAIGVKPPFTLVHT
jgi:ATP-dependent protease HslVU (ClpYQ) peptidase subunit